MGDGLTAQLVKIQPVFTKESMLSSFEGVKPVWINTGLITHIEENGSALWIHFSGGKTINITSTAKDFIEKIHGCTR